MAKKIFILLTSLLVLLCMISLTQIDLKTIYSKILNNIPTFSKKVYEEHGYRFSAPDNLNEKDNEIYPLIVYLHDAGKRGNDNKKQINGLSYLGNGFSKRAKLFREKYPSFVYVPQCPEKTSWNNPEILDMVIKTIEKLKSELPIDQQRIYLIGYSMGGSGTYALADRYYDLKQQKFAAIIRLAGQSSFDNHTHSVISKNSVWIHVGLQDTALRVAKAREAYEKLKHLYKDTVETTEKIVIENHRGTTFTLTQNNIEKVKKTEYKNDGHSIGFFPFSDPNTLGWLFNQKIARP